MSDNIEQLKKENEELKAKLVKVEVFELKQKIDKNKKEIDKLRSINKEIEEEIKAIKASNPAVFPKRGRKPKES